MAASPDSHLHTLGIATQNTVEQMDNLHGMPPEGASPPTGDGDEAPGFQPDLDHGTDVLQDAGGGMLLPELPPLPQEPNRQQAGLRAAPAGGIFPPLPPPMGLLRPEGGPPDLNPPQQASVSPSGYQPPPGSLSAGSQSGPLQQVAVLQDGENSTAGPPAPSQPPAGAGSSGEQHAQQQTPSAGHVAGEEGAVLQEPQGPAREDPGRKVSTADIQLVQNLIERCLQMYMSQQEVVDALQERAKIEPAFTQLVWQKLEEQNPDFFKAYITRLKLKDQINLFNHLLEQQIQVVQQMQQSWMAQGMAAPISGMVPNMAAMTGTQLPSTPQPLNMSGGVVPNGGEEASGNPVPLTAKEGAVPSAMAPGLAAHASVTMPGGGFGGAPPGAAEGIVPTQLQAPDQAQTVPLLSSDPLQHFPPTSPGHSQGPVFPTLDEHQLGTLTKNFSFGDLTLDHLGHEHDHVALALPHSDGHAVELPGMPRNFSLSELARLDVELESNK